MNIKVWIYLAFQIIPSTQFFECTDDLTNSFLGHLNTLMVSSNLNDLNISYMLMNSKFISTAWTSPLNHRLVSPVASWHLYLVVWEASWIQYIPSSVLALFPWSPPPVKPAPPNRTRERVRLWAPESLNTEACPCLAILLERVWQFGVLAVIGKNVFAHCLGLFLFECLLLELRFSFDR